MLTKANYAETALNYHIDMKILQVAPPWIATPPNGYGGTELVIYNLCEELIKLGHDVTLFATKDSKTSAKLKYVFDQGLLDMKMPWNGALPPLIHYQQAFQLFREGNYDMIHVHLSSQTDLMLLPFVSELKKPYVMTIHGHFPYDRYTNFDDFYFSFYKNVSAVAISKTMQEYIPKTIKSDGYVYNGMEVEKMTFNPEPGSYYTWIGRIVHDKGLHHAINAVRKTGDKFIFAGVLNECDKDATQYFKEKIEPYIDGEQIQFLGEADFKMKDKLFSNAKAFLNPIEWVEPFGMVMIESMATGTPVISFSKGAARELVIDGKTGFLVDDEQEMIEAMSRIEEIDRRACRDHVLRNFTGEASAKGYLQLYREKIAAFNRSKSLIMDSTKHLLGDIISPIRGASGMKSIKPFKPNA